MVVCALTVIDKNDPIIREGSLFCPAAQQEEQSDKQSLSEKVLSIGLPDD